MVLEWNGRECSTRGKDLIVKHIVNNILSPAVPLPSASASSQRIAAVRRMIAATELGSPSKEEALEELKEYQRGDFEGIFR